MGILGFFFSFCLLAGLFKRFIGGGPPGPPGPPISNGGGGWTLLLINGGGGGIIGKGLGSSCLISCLIEEFIAGLSDESFWDLSWINCKFSSFFA